MKALVFWWCPNMRSGADPSNNSEVEITTGLLERLLTEADVMLFEKDGAFHLHLDRKNRRFRQR